MTNPDAIIVGGGHNGLVCAFYLARAGLRVTICERRHVVGGAAVTEEFHPGFRNSVASYTVSLLHAQVIADMGLHARGLRILERPISNFLPTEDGGYLKLGGGLERTQAEIAKYSTKDAQRLPAYYAMLDEVGDVLRDLATETPPNLPDGIWGMPRALSQGNRLRRLDLPRQRDVLDLFTKSARDFLDAWFESDPIKAALGFDSIVGNYASPDTPGSAYVLLHHTFGGVNGKKGNWGHAVGGMGAITQAMAQACAERGVDIRLNAAIAEIVTRNGRACGVRLADGTRLDAPIVVSNLNPKLLFTKLVDPAVLDADFRERMRNHKNGLGTFRMNVALCELPDFTCLPGRDVAEHHQSGIVLAPTLDYMDRAYQDARRHGWSREPIVEMLIPSTVGRQPGPARPTRRQPVLPAGGPRAPRPRLGQRARGGGRPDDRHRQSRGAELRSFRARPHQPLTGRFGGEVRLGGRRYHAWPHVARSALVGTTGARPWQLPGAGARVVSMRRGGASGRGRLGHAGDERGAGGFAGYEVQQPCEACDQGPVRFSFLEKRSKRLLRRCRVLKFVGRRRPF